MAIAAGTHLGPYEILALLGAGGMGEVYKARDTRLGRTVAVKVLSPDQADSPDRRQRFQREARAISSLSHPHICGLYDVGEQDGTDYLVMEYLEGQTLAERLLRGPLPFDQLLGTAVQIADALDQAHERRLTHRDLKPGNVMLTKAGAKLLDFGLAKAKALPGTSGSSSQPVSNLNTLTVAGGILGTYQYMSPEQLHGQEADARSDIFAFGAMLYEMATGQPAFRGESRIAVASAILEKEPEGLGGLRPPLFERVVRVCLAKDPAARWQSVRDLRRQLEWIRDGVGQEAGAVPAGKRHATAWAIGLGALALLVVALVLPRGHAPEAGQMQRASVLPPPGMSFEPFNFALSPDGTRLAFVGIGPDGQGSLWVRPLGARAAQELKETRNSQGPFWAPDSRRIGFFADGRLKVVDTSSGVVQVVCDAPIGQGGSWNRTGTIVFANIAGPLLGVSDRGGAPKPVTPVDPQTFKAHRWPSFLPDGRHFLYFQDWGTPGGPLPNGIYVGSLDGGEPKLISADLAGSVFYASGHLLYFQDGSLMAQPFDPGRLELTGSVVTVFNREMEKHGALSQINLSLSETGAVIFQSLSDAASELVWFDRTGSEAGRIPQSGLLHNPELSPNGRFLAATSDDSHNGQTIIRILDLSRGVSTPLTGGGHESVPIWSKDGTRIAYVSGSGPRYTLAQVPADASGDAEVLLEGPQMAPNDYLPDGRGLLYMRLDLGLSHVARYDFSQRTSEDLFPGAEVHLSPDGRWLTGLVAAHGGGLENALQFAVQPFPGPGPQVQISRGGGAQARWSRDGKRLYFVAPDRKLMEVEIDVRDGQLQAGVPRTLFQTRIVAWTFVLFQYDVTADGTRFLINSLKPEAPLTLVTNWPRALSQN